MTKINDKIPINNKKAERFYGRRMKKNENYSWKFFNKWGMNKFKVKELSPD